MAVLTKFKAEALLFLLEGEDLDETFPDDVLRKYRVSEEGLNNITESLLEISR